VKLLLGAGANAAAQDWEGKTALAIAAQTGRSDMIDLLKAR
jgi:ankyrin repeat protein